MASFRFDLPSPHSLDVSETITLGRTQNCTCCACHTSFIPATPGTLPPAYQETEEAHALALMEPRKVSGEDLEQLWESLICWILRDSPWQICNWYTRITFLPLWKIGFEKSKEPMVRNSNYTRGIAIALGYNKRRRSAIAAAIEGGKNCRHHKRDSCYCVKYDCRGTVYFDWKAYSVDDRLEFF